MLKIHKYVTIRQHISDQLMNQRINQNENKKLYWYKKNSENTTYQNSHDGAKPVLRRTIIVTGLHFFFFNQ